jgi:hypothetical protein
MKFKAPASVVLILAVSFLGQTLFGVSRSRATVEHVAHHQDGSSDSARTARLETLLESLRQELKIPAYSPAIVKNQKVIWAKGFGYADDDLLKLPVIAQIVQVLDNEDKSVAFSLASSQDVRIFAMGEGQAGEMFDYGWIEDDKGSRVWEMKEPQTTHAGGAGKNRKVDVQIALPAGNYKLRYKSDDSHSFDHWNALPPDNNFWGIAIYKK